MFEGSNTLVFDVETAKSAQDCRNCGLPELACRVKFADRPDGHPFAPIGWESKRELGLSIGCAFDFQDMGYHWFDIHTLEATMLTWVERQPLLVTYNGREFDGPLLETLLRSRYSAQAETRDSQRMQTLCDRFHALMVQGYDVLQAIWNAVPQEQRYTRGLCSLDAVSVANGYGAKSMTGAEAPRLWAQGRCAEVIQYNYQDVVKTMRLFEQLARTGRLRLGDGREIVCAPPPLSLIAREE